MFELPFTSPDLLAGGPVVEVFVRVPLRKARQLLARGRTVPTPVVVTAVVDTGATYSAFTPDVFERLALSPFDIATIATADGRTSDCDCFDVDLEFVRDGRSHHVAQLNAISASLNGCAVQGLIGRNVLKRAVFWYDGTRNQYGLQFPPEHLPPGDA